MQDIEKDASFLLEKFEKKLKVKNILDLLPKVIQNFYITYDKSYDKICCIFDRDKKSFTARQYDSVIKTCHRQGFSLYISNPCFEFWLLMHFKEVKDVYPKSLLEKDKKGKKTYAQKQLEMISRKYNLSFGKSNDNAVFFIKRLNIALENVKFFSDNNQNLKNELGSSLGILMRELTNLD